MRALKITLLAAGLLVLLGAIILAVWLSYIWRHPPSSAPVASITLLGYTNITMSDPDSSHFTYPERGEWLRARMNLKNEGKVSISYAAWGSEPYGWAKAETPQGLTNGCLAPPFTGGIAVLAPGSNAVFGVWLPADTIRWECGFSVETASVRDRAIGKLVDAHQTSDFLAPVVWSVCLLPDKSGPTAAIKSGSLEIGNGRPPRSGGAANSAQNPAPARP
jgi:hypothetical protein